MSFWRGREGYRREVEEEIRHHLELRTREFREQGMEEDEARRAALEAFGDRDAIEREVLEMRENRRNSTPIPELVAALAQDVRYAVRFLTRNRAFALVAVVTLALGIGATTAIFSLLDGTLLRSPGVRDPGSLVAVYTTSRRGAPRSSSSYQDYIDYRDRTNTLADLAATATAAMSLGSEEPGSRLVTIEMVTGNYFPLLGVSAALGRPLQPADDVRGSGAQVAVLSQELWREAFGGDPDVVGRTIRLNGTPLDVVGVVSEGYEGLTVGSLPDAWVPMQSGAGLRGLPSDVWSSRGSRWIPRLVGRLAPGTTADQASAELLGLSDGMREENPLMRGERTVTVDELGHYLLPVGAEEDLPRFVWMLMAVVGATLLLACANLANLLLARAAARRNEIGIRIAIGAGRARLVRQLLTESLLLSVAGGIVGLLAALGLLHLLGAYELPGGVTVSALDVGLDGRVLTATAALSIATAVVFGLLPALRSTRGGAAGTHRGGDAATRPGSAKLRRALVAVQVALCFVLLAGSGLFVRSLRSALAADLGFTERNVAVSLFDLENHGYDSEEALTFVEELRRRLIADPRVEAAAVANVVPFGGGAFMGTFATVDGYEPAPDEEMRIDQVFTTPGYFETLGIPLLQGRAFTEADAEQSEPVVIVNQRMAEEYWPDGGAVGGILRSPFGEAAPIRVVGVVGNVRWRSIDQEITNFVYLPRAQHVDRAGGFTVVAAQAAGDPEGLLPALRREVHSLEPDLALQVLSTMDELIGERLMPQRLGAVLLSAFGALALILAAVGIVGVVTYTVREQRGALGVRMALGAGRQRILGHVLRSMAAPVAVGLAFGIGGALLLDDAVEGFLYGVSAGDPVTYGAMALGLAILAFVATLVPAREATRLDPLTVLRAE